jgi:membrane-associated phospholipid phosphatase
MALLIVLMGFNTQLFLWLNHNSMSLLNPALWELLTVLGDGWVAMVLLLPLYKHHSKVVLSTLVSGLLAALIVQLFKAGLNLHRPVLVLGNETVTILGPVLKQGSFPSGHTATLFTLFGSMILWLRFTPLRKLLPLLIMLSTLAALSRCVVGAHWPVDILIGATIGWVSAMVASCLTRSFSPSQGTVSWLGRWLTLCAIYLLYFHHTGYQNAQPVLHTIALISLGLSCLQHLTQQNKQPVNTQLTVS